jgi:cardiolipin synthase
MTLSQLPNLITLSRIALVPVLILFLKDQDFVGALAIFVVAGISDGLDGLLAKRLGYTSRFGAILDPIADKTLLVSAYVMLTIVGIVPFWLMLTVAFRDLLIVGGYLAYTSLVGPVRMHPSILSKVNTFMQILLVAVVLVKRAAGYQWPLLEEALIYAVLVTTVTSGAHYVWVWGMKASSAHESSEAGHRG